MTEPTQPKTLGEALLAFQKDIPTLKLGVDEKGQVGSREYKYLTLNKLMASVLPKLNEHGLVWTTCPGSEDSHPVLYYKLLHPASAAGLNDGIGGTFPLMLDKANSQGLGSAITYARRYALTAVLGIVPDDDDDGQAASTSEVPREFRRKRTPPPPAPADPNYYTKPGEQPTQEIDRKMTAEELKLLLDLISEKGEDGRIPLLLASVGVEATKDLSVAQGRDLFRKINV